MYTALSVAKVRLDGKQAIIMSFLWQQRRIKYFVEHLNLYDDSEIIS